MHNRKGDVIISAVLVAGITIALISVAIVWGGPIIEKSSSSTTLLTVQNLIEDINERTEEIANSESGEFTLNIPIGSAELIAYDSGDPPGSNNITLVFPVTQPVATPGQVVFLGATTFKDISEEIGTYGQSSPFIVTLVLEPTSSGFLARLTTHSRELETDNERFIIVFEEGASVGGEGSINIRFDRVDTDFSGGGKPLVKLVHKVNIF